MTQLTRPALGCRAISDMAPLSSPKPDSANNEIGRGTRTTHGGARVVSGKPMALGGIAPFSPFLPMPPAPKNAAGLFRHHDQRTSSGTFDDQSYDGASDDDDDDEPYVYPSSLMGDATVRRASSNDITAAAMMPAIPSTSSSSLKRSAPAKPAPFMIRSYSMPVATQTDYDAQQRVERVRRSQHRALHESWTMSRTNSQASASSGTSTEVEATAICAAESRSPLRQMNTNDVVNIALARSMSRQQSSAITRGAAAAAASASAAVLFSADSHSNASSSDETDVRTPRAVSPAGAALDCGDETAKMDATVETPFFIHPDHMQKPSSWSIS